MADTIGGGINEDGSLQNTLVIDEADLGKIDIVELENAGRTELAVNAQLKVDGLAIGLKGDVDTVIAGKKLTAPSIVNEAPKGKTANTVISNTKTKNLEFTTPGKGNTDLTVKEGKLVKASITTSNAKASDSISFGATTTVNASTIATGRGADTITFPGGVTLKGQTTVESGKGKDVIEVGEKRSGKGKLILSDFSKKDRLVVGDEVLKRKDIKDGDAPGWVRLEA